VRGGRHHRLEARDMGEQRFRALAVRLPAEDAAAERRTHGDRRGELARRTIAQPRRFGHELVQPRIDIVGELDLGHRPQAIGGHAHRHADDAALADRRIEHARPAMARLQPRRRAEHAAEIAHVLADHDDIGIARQHDVERIVDRLDHRKSARRRLRQRDGGFFGAHRHSFQSGHLIRRSRIACSACSSRCQGKSSNTSSNMVLNG
jgi:hypothetical protein